MVYNLKIAASCLCALFMLESATYGQKTCLWKVGCAKIDITPEEPVWLAGYAFRDHPSEGVRQTIWAKALLLEDYYGNRGLIVTMDLLCVPRDFSETLKKHLADDYALEKSQIILNVSHTHSAPVIGRSLRYVYPMSDGDWKVVDTYTDSLMKKLRSLVGEALKGIRPASVSSGNGIARFAVNRRNNKEKDLTSVSEIAGPSDHAVPVLKVEDCDGNMMTILFGYACHNTVISDYLVGGDYAGYAQEIVERNHPGSLAMFFQGAGGDQNPLPRRKPSLAEQYGNELGAAVEQALSDGMTMQRPTLCVSYKETMLPLESPPSLDNLSKTAEGTGYQAKWARGILEKVTGGEELISEYPYPIQFWKIGAQKIFVFGGELVSGYAVAVKERYGKDVFVMGYSNDVMSYIPTPVMWDEGGYEVDLAHCVYALPARWTRDVYDIILESVGLLVDKVENEEKQKHRKK